MGQSDLDNPLLTQSSQEVQNTKKWRLERWLSAKSTFSTIKSNCWCVSPRDFETGSCYMAQAVIHSPPASASLCWNYTTMHSLFNVRVRMCVCIVDILYMYFFGAFVFFGAGNGTQGPVRARKV